MTCLKTAVESLNDDTAVRLSSEIIDKSAFPLKQPKCHKSCKINYASTKTIKQQEEKTLVHQDSGSSTSSVNSELVLGQYRQRAVDQCSLKHSASFVSVRGQRKVIGIFDT